MKEENNNKDVLDAWILNKFQVVSDKSGEWFVVDNFKISNFFMKIWIITIIIQWIIISISYENTIEIIINTIFTIFVVLIFSIIWLVVHIFGKAIKNIDGDISLVNPLREELMMFRVIFLVMLLLEIISFDNNFSWSVILRQIEVFSHYLFFVFASLEYKKPTGKTAKERLKELISSTDTIPVPA